MSELRSPGKLKHAPPMRRSPWRWPNSRDKPEAYPTATIKPGASMYRLVLTSVLSLAALHAQEFTRGVGVYPGDPKQNWSPTLQPASDAYRNLALHRPAYHSSSYDFNLTAQLITDGVA